MNRFAKSTLAAAALSLTVFATGAANADEVVSLRGKNFEQIKTDLRLAAETVCKQSYSKALLGHYAMCVDSVYEDALRHMPIDVPAQ